jgi:hypothetical protein
MKVQPMKVIFPLSQVVVVLEMVVLTILEASLSFGVRRSTTIAAPGAATFTTTVVTWAGATTTSRSEHPSVASGTEESPIASLKIVLFNTI